MNESVYRRVEAGETLTWAPAGRALWRLSGPDRARYLNGQVTADVARIAQDEASLAAVCTAKGRMEGALWIAAHGDAFYLDADPELRETLGPRLDKYLIADDALLEDVTDEMRFSHVFGRTAPAQPEGGLVISHARFGLPGHDVWRPGTSATVVGETVEDDVVETLRIERAIPRWNAELTAQTLPPEAGPVMLDAISYTKGCYVGQETIARLKSVGHVNRTLVFLVSTTPEIPPPGTKLATPEKEVGSVTSSAFSPRLGVGIALGYLPPILAAEGTTLQAGGQMLRVVPPLKDKAGA